MGGLGVSNIMYKNLILLFKWWWRFFDTDFTLWKRILLSVQKIKGLKASADAFSDVKDGIWGQLMSNDAETSKIRSIVEEGMYPIVGCGTSIRFWHDKWNDAGPLKESNPRLFALSLQRNCYINQIGKLKMSLDWKTGWP